MPAVLSGVSVALAVTHTTLNVQSLMGAIMSIGVSVANALLLVTFARDRWRAGETQERAVLGSAHGRLRPILMTSLAMILGMVPTAAAFGEGGEQSAPLGRAVIGGLVASTIATLLFLPAIYVIVGQAGRPKPTSLDPDDAESASADPPPRLAAAGDLP
jgi:multidrug efflux pump subunit AcrB